MSPHRPTISPLGWYVELPDPAHSLISRRREKTHRVETTAGLAQAFVYLFQQDRIEAELERLESEGGRFALLAQALRAEAKSRRGDYDGACALLGRLETEEGPMGAWAGLRRASALERVGRVEEAKQILVASRKRQADEPPLLRAMVEARLEFHRGQVDRAARTLEGAANQLEGAPDLLAASFHRAWAICLTLLHDVPRAQLHHRLALDGFRRLGDRFMLVKEYLSLGQTYMEIGELDHAEFFFHKAEVGVEEMDHIELEALLTSRLGLLALVRGDLDTARTLFKKDLHLCEKTNTLYGQAYARRNLGKVMVQLGEVEEGRRLLVRSQHDFEGLTDPLNRNLSRLEETTALLSEPGDGDFEKIRLRLDALARFFSEVGRRELEAQVGVVRARLLVGEGKVALARKEMEVNDRILQEHSKPGRMIEAWLSLASSLERNGETDEAVYYLRRAYRAAVGASRHWMAKNALDRLGAIDERVVMDLVDEPQAPDLSDRDLSPSHFEHFLVTTDSPVFREILEQAKAVAPTDEMVLIHGETGTGKEMIARFIHAHSRRGEKKFVPMNCGAMPDGLIESEFFGHVRGAFTDAKEGKLGIFEAAEGGTVFLDEVGELSRHGQVTLLRFLEDRQVRPLGSQRSSKVDVRIVAATNLDLREEMGKGIFRKDLYYRLTAFPIHVPPLRKRKEDIEALASFLLENNTHAQEKGLRGISKSAMKLFLNHDWGGNLRELRCIISAAAIRCKGRQILKRDLPTERLQETLVEEGFLTLDGAIRKQIEDALGLTGGHKGRTADLLGIHRNTLAAKMKALHID